MIITHARRTLSQIAIALALFLFAINYFLVANPQSKALLLTINGSIGPATSDYVVRGIAEAVSRGDQLLILAIDTPGGLATAMHDINKAILNSPLPILSYVSPSGARAASAGTYILYASHIAAMAPGTNLGAATPVDISGAGELPNIPEQPAKPGVKQPASQTTGQRQAALPQKVANDALAYIRSLAQLRGRNATWATQAVTQAATLTATEALQQHVIDIVAADFRDLLRQVDGRQINLQGRQVTLRTRDMMIEALKPDWRNKFLAVVTEPSITYILLLLGIYGLFFEFANPGFVLPGVVGAIAMIIAMYALQLLPVNYAGLGLLFLGILFMVAEAFMPSFGALGLGGIVAFIMGSILLFDTSVPGYYLAWPLILAMAAANAGFIFMVIGMAIKAHRGKVVSGREQLLGQIAEVTHADGHAGYARMHGELWRVKSATPLFVKARVVVIGVDGLTLTVKLSDKHN